MADDKQKRVAFSRSMKFDRDPHVKALTVSGHDSRNVKLATASVVVRLTASWAVGHKT